MLQKYQKDNFAVSESYRLYNEFVPEYLQGQPRSVILHCLSRIMQVDSQINQWNKWTGLANLW